jgi:hypothetical protein
MSESNQILIPSNPSNSPSTNLGLSDNSQSTTNIPQQSNSSSSKRRNNRRNNPKVSGDNISQDTQEKTIPSTEQILSSEANIEVLSENKTNPNQKPSNTNRNNQQNRQKQNKKKVVDSDKQPTVIDSNPEVTTPESNTTESKMTKSSSRKNKNKSNLAKDKDQVVPVKGPAATTPLNPLAKAFTPNSPNEVQTCVPCGEKKEEFSSEFYGACPICSNEFSAYMAIGLCNHPICSLCTLRVRLKSKNKDCAICKARLEIMIIYRIDETPYITNSIPFTLLEHNEIDLTDSNTYRTIPDSSIDYENRLIYYKCRDHFLYMDAMKSIHCPDQKCSYFHTNSHATTDRTPYRYATMKQLTSHIHQKHENMALCNLCLENRSLFLSEYELMTKRDLRNHMTKGKFITLSN